jgi:DNA-binding response OmpR family regulator
MQEWGPEVLVLARSEDEVRDIEAQIHLPCAQWPGPDANEALDRAALLVILGWEVDIELIGSQLRALTRAPILLIIAAEATLDEKVRGIEAGADLVLSRDVREEELRARVNALIRRNHMPPASEIYRLLKHSTL